ncbi:MAG: septum formation family protein [Gemmatimonadota bacterium]
MFEGKSFVPVAIVGLAAAIGLTRAAERGADGAIIEAGQLSAFEVQVGDCFDDEAFSASEISEIPAIPCSTPHDNEVYATFDVSAEEFPGDDEIDWMASEGCYERFEAAIGKSYEDSVIDFTTMYPSSGSWKNGDREVVCIGFHMELEKLEETIIGSGI